MKSPIAYLNGKIIPARKAGLPLHDAGVVSGATVTDFVRTFGHRLFRLPDHLARLRAGCDTVGIELAGNDVLTGIAAELVSHNAPLLPDGGELALVFIATPGQIGLYAGEPGVDGPPTLAAHTFPLPFARFRRMFREGARLRIPSVRQLPAACIDPRIKQRSRLHWWLADREVRAVDPLASAVLLDLDGHLTETAAANLLLVERGTVVSPPAETILGGVSLGVVRELCGRLGIPFAERPVTPADCFAADEILLSNTSYCLAGVSNLDGRPVPWPGPVWRHLLTAWNDLAGLDIAWQILSGG